MSLPFKMLAAVVLISCRSIQSVVEVKSWKKT